MKLKAKQPDQPEHEAVASLGTHGDEAYPMAIPFRGG